jgi:hypothetical protein
MSAFIPDYYIVDPLKKISASATPPPRRRGLLFFSVNFRIKNRNNGFQPSPGDGMKILLLKTQK